MFTEEILNGKLQIFGQGNLCLFTQIQQQQDF